VLLLKDILVVWLDLYSWLVGGDGAATEPNIYSFVKVGCWIASSEIALGLDTGGEEEEGK
jgi:hypothetical protein